MSSLTLTRHASVRMAQRSIKLRDAELIALVGTQVEDGCVVRFKDYQVIETELKQWLTRLRRTVGKRLVISDGKIVTAYHLSKANRRRLLRGAKESDLLD